MTNRKRMLVALAFTLALALVLGACGGPPVEIAMIPDAYGVEDEGMNQGAWEGVWLYANLNGKSCNYYTPSRQSPDAYMNAIDLAAKNGADVIVALGGLYEDVLGKAQDQHNQTRFIVLNGEPEGGPSSNAVSVMFAEEQAGYLAGYAAVKEGYDRLGFLGGSAQAASAVRFGLGYLQGAEAAAKETGRRVEVNYAYTEGFGNPEAEARQRADGWYQQGTQLIFTCCGLADQSVYKSAEEWDGKTMGAGIDQSEMSPTVVATAFISVGAAAGRMLERYHDEEFPGGWSVVSGVEDGAVGLTMETARFEEFSQNEYDALLRRISSGDIQILRDGGLDNPSGNPEDFPLNLTAVTLRFRGEAAAEPGG